MNGLSVTTLIASKISEDLLTSSSTCLRSALLSVKMATGRHANIISTVNMHIPSLRHYSTPYNTNLETVKTAFLPISSVAPNWEIYAVMHIPRKKRTSHSKLCVTFLENYLLIHSKKLKTP